MCKVDPLPNHQGQVNPVSTNYCVAVVAPEASVRGVSSADGCSSVGLADAAAQAVTAISAEGRSTTIHPPPGEIVGWEVYLGSREANQQQSSNEQDENQYG